MGYIYKILFNDQPVYIGQTIKSLEERWKEHKTYARTGRGFAIHNAMRKYGIENFNIVLIEKIEDIFLNEREQYWIKELQTHISENGYNLTRGGDFRPEYIKVPCYQYSLEGNFIQEFSSISEAARAVNGFHENILKVMQGTLNLAYNYRWSYKKLEKLPVLNTKHTGKSKKILQYDLNGNFINSYASSKAAARALNVSQGNISSVANGKRKSAYGFLWKYA